MYYGFCMLLETGKGSFVGLELINRCFLTNHALRNLGFLFRRQLHGRLGA
jgi:hypothetical protein